MNYAQFATNYPDEFREAFGDLSMHRIACLFDKGDALEVGQMIRANLESAKDSIEDDLTPGGEYGEEARLDRRDRAIECNREAK